MIRRSLAAAAAMVVLSTGSALASYCENYTAQYERALGIPAHLLAAVARAETGYVEPEEGTVRAWPWTISSSQGAVRHPSKWAAIEAVRDLRRYGLSQIKVGCMQIDLHRHGNAFRSLDEALDPQANVAYGARLLKSLHRQTGDWKAAVARFHSPDPDKGALFQHKVANLWDGLRADATLAAWFDDSVAAPTGPDRFAYRSYRWHGEDPARPSWRRRVWQGWYYDPDIGWVSHRRTVWSDDDARYRFHPYSRGGPWRPVGTSRFN